MTGLLLSTLLSLSPGVQLADTTDGRHIRLVDDEDAPRLEGMSREQLHVELTRLQDTRPSLGMPIVLLAVGVAALFFPGVGVTIAGVGVLAASLATRMGMGLTTIVGGTLIGLGVVMGGVGIVLAIIGGVTLGAKIRGRTLNGRAQDEVRRRLDAIDNGIPPPQAVPPEIPQARRIDPSTLQTVFVF